MQASEEYRGQDSFFDSDPPLSSFTGAVIIVGLGSFFTLFGLAATYFHLKFNKIKLTSEYFSTAGRHVGVGMTACAIVSSWTWSATILQSSNVTWQFGVSGSLWYAAGASIQLFLFAALAYKFKKYAPNAHTIGEVIYVRWGVRCHIVFLYFFFTTNLLVLAMLIGGGSRVFEVLTGLDRGTSSFFIRMTFFTGSGGLITSYISAHLHVSIVFLITTYFVIYVFFFSPELGSPNEIYDRIVAVENVSDQTCIDFGYDPDTQSCGGINGNLEGSYLTVQSMPGLTFGIINIVGNFGAVFVDQSYWQIAISAHRDSVFAGFILGGLLWFTIPFCMSTALGLANIALQLPTNIEEANKGLVAVASAVHLNGTFGGKLLMIQLFMAVCAAGSTELNTVSSILIYDVYRTYLKPTARSREMKYYARLSVLGSGSLLGGLAVLVNSLGISLGWLYLCMGILIGSAVCPITCLLVWKKATENAAICASLGGQALAVLTWLTLAYLKFGHISLVSTGDDMVMLVGNLVALLSSCIIMMLISLWNPDNYDFHELKNAITLVITEKDAQIIDKRESSVIVADHNLQPFAGKRDTSVSFSTETPFEKDLANEYMYKLSVTSASTAPPRGNIVEAFFVKFSKSKKYIPSYCFTILIVLLWPAFSAAVGVFDKGYFYFWVMLATLWCLVSTCIIIVLPIYENWTPVCCVAVGFFEFCKSFFPKKGRRQDTQSVLEHNVEKSDTSSIMCADM